MPSLPETAASEEQELLGRVASGDRKAFRDVYDRYSGPLYSLALRLVHDAGTAEEALQDTFLKIWHHAVDYDSRKARPFTWAVTILRRTCIDHLRKHQRSLPSVSLVEEPGASELATGETTRLTAERNETTTRLRGALATVASPQREALELALFSTLTQPEIAAQLAHPVGTIKTWIRRGLLDLRARLSETAP